MYLRLATFLVLLGFSALSFAQSTTTPKREVRAVWLTTLKNLDWPHNAARDNSSRERQKRELCEILDKYQKANINTVLLQAVVRASTIYPSAIYPWDACMSGRFGISPGYDPLAFAIEECHKRGMEVQAWMATLPVGPYNGAAARRLRGQGYKMFKLDGDAFLDPSSPATGNLIAAVAREITTHYDIDGIHLDYIRYPEMLPSPRNEYIAQWRRDNITSIVRKVHNAVKAEKPWVKVSCSPIGKYSDLSRYSSNNWNARDRVGQDAQLWLRLGLMDQLYPMIYFRGNNFYPFAADWSENKYGKTIASGLGTYFLDSREGGKYGWTLSDIVREMLVSRQMELGTAHFRSQFFTDNNKGIYDFVSEIYSPYPALVPAMTWIKTTLPTAPTKLDLKNGSLTISGNSSKGVYYNVYASNKWPVDVTDAHNLVLQRYASNIVRLPERSLWKPRYFAVTVMDRYGNESKPVQSWQKPDLIEGQLDCDGDYVMIDTDVLRSAMSSEGYFIITNPQGQTVMKIKHAKDDFEGCGTYENSFRLDISNIKEGTYLISNVSRYSKKKSSTKRIGFFVVKR